MKVLSRACYPGSFDPVTRGHLDLIRRGALLFGSLTVAVGISGEKTPLFTLEERLSFLQEALSGEPAIEVKSFSGLLADFCRREGIGVVLRGLRGPLDFEGEYQMGMTNRRLHPGLETLFLLPAEEHAFTSSRLIKEVARSGGPLGAFVEPAVARALQERFVGELP